MVLKNRNGNYRLAPKKLIDPNVSASDKVPGIGPHPGRFRPISSGMQRTLGSYRNIVAAQDDQWRVSSAVPEGNRQAWMSGNGKARHQLRQRPARHFGTPLPIYRQAPEWSLDSSWRESYLRL